MIGPFLIVKRWWLFWLPPWGRFQAITLAPFVILRPGWSESTLRHELIHIRQVRLQGWWRFYYGYLWEWRFGWRLIGGTSYVNLRAELEAYEHQHDDTHLPFYLERLVRSDDA